VEKWPEWARPVAWTALAFGAYSLIRLIFMIPALMQQPSKWWIALGGLAASIAIGGALGLVIGAIRMLRKRTMSWRRRDHIPR